MERFVLSAINTSAIRTDTSTLLTQTASAQHAKTVGNSQVNYEEQNANGYFEPRIRTSAAANRTGSSHFSAEFPLGRCYGESVPIPNSKCISPKRINKNASARNEPEHRNDLSGARLLFIELENSERTASSNTCDRLAAV